MIPVTSEKEMQETLRGIRVWNLKDGSFIGLVVTATDRIVHDVMRQVYALKLGPVRLLNWYERKIVFESGAEIRVRSICTYTDSLMHAGQEYWAVCYLQKVTDDAYRFINSRVRWPATHEPRLPGVRSRIGDKLAREAREALYARNRAALSKSVSYKYEIKPWPSAQPQMTGEAVKLNSVNDGRAMLTPRLQQDKVERDTAKGFQYNPALQFKGINSSNVKITGKTGDGLILWTDQEGNVCVLPREAINADFEKSPPKTWEQMTNFFVAMTATQLGETQQKFQKQLDEVNTRISTLGASVSHWISAVHAGNTACAKNIEGLRADVAELQKFRDHRAEEIASFNRLIKIQSAINAESIAKVAALREELDTLKEAHRKQVGLLHKRVTKRKVEIAAKKPARKKTFKTVYPVAFPVSAAPAKALEW